MRKSLLVLSAASLAAMLAGASAARAQGNFGAYHLDSTGAPVTNNAGAGGICGFGGGPTEAYTALDPQTLNNGHLGVVQIGPDIYVSSRGMGAAPPHLIYNFTAAPPLTLVGQWPQPAVHNAVAWGIRDMCTDGVSIIGGSGAGITVSAPGGGLVGVVQAVLGPQPVINPIVGAGLAAVGGTYRALAYDPAGNGNTGSFWTANFASPLVEIDLAGNVLGVPWPPAGWSLYGLALDPLRPPGQRRLVGNCLPNDGDLCWIDTTTGVVTNLTLNAWRDGVNSSQGGLSPAGRPPFGPYGTPAGRYDPWPTIFSVVNLMQGNPADQLFVQCLDAYPGIRGHNEAQLQNAVNGGALDQSMEFYVAGDIWNIMLVDPAGTVAPLGFLGWDLFTNNNDALTPIPPPAFIEARIPWLGSIPPKATTIWTAIAPNVMINVGPIPPPVAPNHLHRLQAVFIDAAFPPPNPPLPFMVSNEAHFGG